MRRTFAVLSLPILLALAGCGTQEKPSPSSSTSAVAAVKAAHEAYLKGNASGYDWFANASDGYGGVPLILLRALPDLAPEIWGKPEEQFSRFGFLPNPDGPLPLGLSWDSMDPGHPAQQLHPVALTCGSCHIGRVRLENGAYATLVGGPNTQFDVRKWRKAFELTVHKVLSTPKNISATADRMRKVIAEKPANYFYQNYRGVTDQVEAGERQAFVSTAGGKDMAATILTGFAGKILLGEVAIDKQKATSYSKPNAPPLEERRHAALGNGSPAIWSDVFRGGPAMETAGSSPTAAKPGGCARPSSYLALNNRRDCSYQNVWLPERFE